MERGPTGLRELAVAAMADETLTIVSAIIAGGGFVATAASAAFAWVQAKAALDAKEIAQASVEAASESAQAATRQATAAEQSARLSERQAGAAEASVAVAKDAAAAASRQAVAAESSNEMAAGFREADRRADAIIALSKMMIDSADLAMRAIDRAASRLRGEDPGPRLTQLDRFRINETFIRGQSLLPGDDVAVARWSLAESSRLFAEVEAQIDLGSLDRPEVGPARGAAMRIATETISTLFAWQRGERPTDWFVEQIREE